MSVIFSPWSLKPVSLPCHCCSVLRLTRFCHSKRETNSSLPPALGYTAFCKCSKATDVESRARSVRLIRSSAAIVIPVSSAISLAAAPANDPASSIIPAGSSTKASDPAGTRGCTVRMTYLSSSLSSVTSSDCKMSYGSVGPCLIMHILTSIPTLPPRRNTLPGRLSCASFVTSALSFTKPSRPPPKRSML